MERRALVIAWVLGCASVASASPKSARPAKHPEMLALLEGFLSQPYRGPSDDRLIKIGEFALRSPDVSVDFDNAVIPYFHEDLDNDAKRLLLAGYLAGNAAAQLRAGVRGNHRLAGVEGEIRIYITLKALASTKLKDFKVVSRSMDALLLLYERGELPAHLAPVGQPVATSTPAASPPSPEAEDKNMVWEGFNLITAGHAQEAISQYFDKVIAKYEAKYANEKQHVYCAHNMAETALYMLQSLDQHDDAIAIVPAWAVPGSTSRTP